MTAEGIQELIKSFETEIKSLWGSARTEDPDEWEPPSLERIKRRMARS